MIWKATRKLEPERERATVFVRRDALLYHAMVDKALSHNTDRDDWSWDVDGRGIWVSRDWFPG